MKFATIIASVLLLASPNLLVSGASLRREHGNLGDDLDHRRLGQLKSAQCAPMMKKKAQDTLKLAATYSTAEVADYICNAVQRNTKASKQKAMEKNMATQIDPCLKAYMRENVKKTGFILDALSSTQNCVLEVTKEMQALKQIAKKGISGGDDAEGDINVENEADKVGDSIESGAKKDVEKEADKVGDSIESGAKKDIKSGVDDAGGDIEHDVENEADKVGDDIESGVHDAGGDIEHDVENDADNVGDDIESGVHDAGGDIGGDLESMADDVADDVEKHSSLLGDAGDDLEDAYHWL